MELDLGLLKILVGFGLVLVFAALQLRGLDDD